MRNVVVGILRMKPSTSKLSCFEPAKAKVIVGRVRVKKESVHHASTVLFLRELIATKVPKGVAGARVVMRMVVQRRSILGKLSKRRYRCKPSL